jgi:opacity protein-like surface antigen
MISKLKLSASAAALALLVAGAVSSAQAADVVADEGCTLSGAVGIGYMYDWQKSDFDFGQEDSIDGDVDWNTPFGEAGGLVTCGGFNAQADFAYYNHQGDADIGLGKLEDVDGDNSHFGGALFWRDPSYAALGVSASWINQDVFSKDSDTFRAGLFGEFYMDNFTLGASAHYFNGEVINIGPLDIDQDGFELAAWGRFYATPDLSLMLRGDVLLANIDVPNQLTDEDVNLNGWAITGEAEYLVWDQGLSVFGGLRYAERSLDVDNENFDIDIDDTQVYAGLKFYFGQDGSLMDRQRTGVVDNTSVFQEKLPNFLTSGILGIANAASGGMAP